MNRNLFNLLFYFLITSFVFVSCNELDDVETPVVGNEYLVEAELQFTISKTLIDLAIATASNEYTQITQASDLIQSGIKVYKITYKTTFDNELITASGVVAIPDTDGNYPVLSYQNGTNTEHANAPSVDSEKPLYIGNLDVTLFKILEMMGSTGFIISIPDYLGFGESDNMFHPYLHRESTVKTVTDMLHAVREFIDGEDGVSLNNNLYLAGYSQGGWATMQVQQTIESDVSFTYNLKASACSAGPYNLTSLNNYITGLDEYPQPYFLAYIFNSYLELGLTTPINTVFKETYAEKITTIFDGQTSGNDLNNELTTTITDLLTSDYLTGWNSDEAYAPVRLMLAENSVPDFIPTVPTKLFYGTNDNYVPAFVSEEKYDDFIAGGAAPNIVEKVPLAGLNHGEGVFPSGLASILWFIEMEKLEL